MSGADRPREARRPLSPHLGIYRPDMTMLMSIAHRITGIILYAGMLPLALWLLAAASGPQPFATAQMIYGGWFGLALLVGYGWASAHHLLGGIRHLMWDFGLAMGPRGRQWLAHGTLAGSLALTALGCLALAVA